MKCLAAEVCLDCKEERLLLEMIETGRLRGNLPLQSRREEGLLAFWKGNGANVIRIFPYSAAQLGSHDLYKRLLAPSGGG